MHVLWPRLSVAVIALTTLSVCRPLPSSPRCSAHPPAGKDYGTCSLVLGYHFEPQSFTCVSESGCACDDSCRTNEIPFRSLEECESVCLTSQ